MKGPFSGNPSTATGSAGLRGSERQAAQSEIPDSQHGDVVARIERDHVRRQSAAGLQLDDGVVLTRDDVGRSHDEIGPRGPAGALHSDVRKPSRARARRWVTRDARRPRARRPRVRRRDRRRPGPRWSGRDRSAPSTFSTSVGGMNFVQPLQERRALRTAAKVGLPGQQSSATAPSTQTTASPLSAPSTRPPVASKVVSLGLRTLERSADPASVPSVSSRIAPTAAPARAASGV